MKLIQQLAESHLLTSKSSYRKYSAKQISELVYLHVIALRILASEPLTHKLAHDYALRSSRYSGFAQWYQNATDLHLLIHALVSEDVDLKMPEASQEFKETLYFDEPELKRWLKEISQNRISESHTRSLFIHLDGALKIKNTSMKAIRRIVQDWPHNNHTQNQLAMTRLLQIMRVRCRTSDLMAPLNDVAEHHGLELKNVANAETGDEARHDGSDPEHMEHKKKGVGILGHVAAFAGGMLGYSTIKSLMGEGEEEDENALEEDGGACAAGATTSAAVATVAKPLGSTRRRIPRKKLKQ